MVDLAAQSEYLGALGLLGTHGGEPVGALEDDLRDVGVGLNVVEDGGLSVQALDSRERGTGTGLAALAFDRGHQSGLLAAYERARAQTQLDVEIEAGAEDILAEQAVFMRLIDRDLQSLDSDRILRTDIDVALGGADRVACDRHRFQNDVGIALENGTVHERAGVAFVGVAADILLICVVACGEFPFQTGGEARAAAASQTGVEHGLDDLLGGHLGEDLAQSGITVVSDIIVDLFGIDNAAVSQSDALLLLIESSLVEGLDGVLFNGLLIEQTGHDTALVQMLLNDLGNILQLYHGVEGAFRINDHDRAESAKTEAAGGDDVDFLIQTLRLELFLELISDQ